MTLTQQRMYAIILLLIVSLLAGCATNIPENKSFCLIYRPVYTSDEDTEQTRAQCDANNAAYECLCVKESKLCKSVKRPDGGQKYGSLSWHTASIGPTRCSLYTTNHFGDTATSVY